MKPSVVLILAGVAILSFQIANYKRPAIIAQRYVHVIEIGPNAMPKTYVLAEPSE